MLQHPWVVKKDQIQRSLNMEWNEDLECRWVVQLTGTKGGTDTNPTDVRICMERWGAEFHPNQYVRGWGPAYEEPVMWDCRDRQE